MPSSFFKKAPPQYGSTDNKMGSAIQLAEYPFKKTDANTNEKMPSKHEAYQSEGADNKALKQDQTQRSIAIKTLQKKAEDALHELDKLRCLLEMIEKSDGHMSHIRDRCENEYDPTSQARLDKEAPRDALHIYKTFIQQVITAKNRREIFEKQLNDFETSTSGDPELKTAINFLDLQYEYYLDFCVKHEAQINQYVLYAVTLKRVIDRYASAKMTKKIELCMSNNAEQSLKKLDEKINAINQLSSTDLGKTILRYAVATKPDFQNRVMDQLKVSPSELKCCNDFITHVEEANARQTYINEMILGSIGDALNKHPECRNTNGLGRRFDAFTAKYDAFQKTHGRKLEGYIQSANNLKAIINLYQQQIAAENEKPPAAPAVKRR